MSEAKYSLGEFVKSNLFAMVQMGMVLVALGYFNGELHSAVDVQNRAIRQMRGEITSLQSNVSSGQQNTIDIARLRTETDSITGKLDQISDQLSRLSQWVKDHRKANGIVNRMAK